MLHTTIGQAGHFFVILSFVAALVSAFSYLLASKKEGFEHQSWISFARKFFYIHAISVLGIVVVLFSMIYNHYYEYHYVWEHSSNNLPTHFMISCFWEGQEGSFLLWIFWHALLGLILMRTSKTWEAPVMSTFIFVQAFLTSMILGVVIPIVNVKIGSSPFLLMREAMDAPIFQMNPDFIPTDGSGLNALLQNYWMVIHPPTLFLGFALTLVPFAYCIAALQKGEYKAWLKPVFPWVLICVVILGVGIMMGAYWAYETLNFGGYWNWDPVENAVYIPWIVLVAALHLMLASERNTVALKATFITLISVFILILYSTFLTRSGILGESSVHSFTDLGLSGQLLIYLLVFTGLGISLLIVKWKHLPSSDKETSAYSGEFWIFIGATVLLLSAFQVLVPTSMPVYNAILNALGIDSNLAPPSDQVEFYTKFQLWFAIGIGFVSGFAQFFWWNKLDKATAWLAMSSSAIISMIISAAGSVIAHSHDFRYILVLTAGVFAIVSNVGTFFKLAKSNFNLSGGAVSHIGIALMIIGILASSGYSKIVSLNSSGLLYSRDFSEEMNRDNLLLFRNQAQKMRDYTLIYKGIRVLSEDVEGYIDFEKLRPTANPFKMVANGHIEQNGKTVKHRGDTLQVYGENQYYEINYSDTLGTNFTLYPRIQTNEQMGIITSPDIKVSLFSDLYTHITGYPDPEKEREWSKPEEYILSLGDTFIVNDYIAILKEVTSGKPPKGIDYVLLATIEVLDKELSYIAQPTYMTQGNEALSSPFMLESAGIKFTFKKVNQNDETKDFTFSFEAQTTQKDWIILNAAEKPFISLLWIGLLIMSIGVSIATVKRFKLLN
jgi:cytochrome c-type biogenesis protein CcmF